MSKLNRLYERFRPDKYILELNPDKINNTFHGSVIIAGKKVGRPSKRLTFHAKDLKVNNVKVTFKHKGDTTNLEPNRIATHKKYDELRIHFDQLIYPGEYTVEITFSGKITRPMNGLYPCFFNQEGQDQILLATQFESHHAREVFPCIDEPEAKAVFELTIHSQKDETVLANTLPVSSKTKDDRVITTFEPTPIMSTYLLAFVIGKVEYLESATKSGITVRTYATRANVQYTAFALEVAVKCIELYNDYFGIDYPLKKCDLIALPDFASGAMENWGLLTFREQALLVDPDNTSLAMKQYVANVVAHEITHQWFGNLVTMQWWNDLWLNESFATLMSYVAVDSLFPEWKVWTQFIVDEQNPALRLDSLENTHPINVDIKHPDEIRTIFDNISYEKGASVLLMLMRYLGEDYFKVGLNLYLKRHAYQNTQSSDLWKAWEEISNRPIADFMDSWTKQAGYPLVKVSIEDKELVLEQDRFYINPKATKIVATWPIPLFSNIKLETPIINKQTTSLTLNSISPLLINQGHSAFYRAIYSPEQIGRIKERISNNNIDELDRQGLLSDMFEASKAGYLSAVDCLNLLDAYVNESSVVVWEVISANLGSIRLVMDDEKLREAMNPFIVKLAQKQYDRLGWEQKVKDSHFDKLLRPLVIGLMAIAEDKTTLDEVKARFLNMSSQQIHPDLRGLVYTTIARHGGSKEFDQLLTMHNKSQNSEERISLAAALTNFKQTELIDKSLALIMTKDVRLQDVSYWISYSFSNRYAKQKTWEWLKLNWGWLASNLEADLSFYMMPRYVARVYSDETFLPEFKKFFEANISEAFERPIKQAIETITWQSEWKRRDLATIKKYFSL